jgi:CRISPR-associated exonuclease Cas4
MLKQPVPAGALFYGATRRRLEVAFDPALRQLTEETAMRLHQLLDRGSTPPPDPQPRCKNCSLINLCLPKAAMGRSAARYLQRMIAGDLAE